MADANGIKPIVCKFGGTSVADAEQLRKVRDIVRADPRRRYVVVSAFGRRPGVQGDHGCTDLLFLAHQYVKTGFQIEPSFRRIRERHRQFKTALQLDVDIEQLLLEVEEGILDIATHETPDFAASRGEYMMAKLVATFLDLPFVDASEVIFFDDDGKLDAARTQAALAALAVRVDRAVFPGFYGVMPNGAIKTFSRGGSDISGALVAKGVGAELYENWTDVPGLLTADPRVVASPKPIAAVSYTELHELAYAGAKVIHPEAVIPVRQAGIPVNIKNTNDPDNPGTMIVPDDHPFDSAPLVTGIAGRQDFRVLQIAKEGMNAEQGIGSRLLAILARHSVNWEHMPTSLDTISLVIHAEQLRNDKERLVLNDVHRELEPDSVVVLPHMALVATVGRRMAHTPGIAGRLFSALGAENINVRMINQGASEISIIIGVENADCERAMRAIYQAFFA